MSSADLRIYDNTEVSTHRTCNRKHFFRHELHLRLPGAPAPALTFGVAWHKACDVIWSNIGSMSKNRDNAETIALAKMAYAAWSACWTAEGYPDADSMDKEWETRLGARTPNTAINMILSYIVERWDIIRHQFKLIAVEQPFIVPLDPADTNLWYSGRLDKVVEQISGRTAGKVFFIDHKSTTAYGKAKGFLNAFLESFSPNSQVDGYGYGARMLYGDAFGGAYIDGALVHKDHHDIFCFLPVSRSQDQLDAWLWETREEIRRIEADRAALHLTYDDLCAPIAAESGADTLSYLPAAPKNTGACYDFNSPCPYLDICKSWGNPLPHIIDSGPPDGYAIEPWSPFTPEQKAEVAGLIKEFHRS